MCGISGLVACEPGGVDLETLRAMTAALAHRGPDGEGYHEGALCGLGHRRLAVLDLEGGAQPLYGAGGEVACVANGEIYNFRALRRELEARGHGFSTRTDSEVIAHGYAEWGDGVLGRLEGMFALAIWDARARRLVLARDRLGEKPLFFARLAGQGLAFASELRALLRHPEIEPRVCPDALARYLVYEYVPAPRAIVAGVEKLCPGEKLVFEGGRARVERYWDLPLIERPAGGRTGDLGAAADELLGALRRSVRERLVADVPLGVFLSGGLDSSLVAALAAEVRGGELETFSVGFPDPTYDESSYARRVAEHLGTRHHERRVEARDLLAIIPRLGELLDEPLGDGSLVPTYLLSSFARERVTVALGGEGADELFGGYPTFLAEELSGPLLGRLPERVLDRARRAGRKVAGALPVSERYLSADFAARQFVRGAFADPVVRHQAWLASLLPGEVPAILAPDVADALEVGGLLDDALDRVRRCRSENRWDRLLYFYAKGYLGDDVLAKLDRASMEVALEVRAPMLDREVVRLACRAEPSLRFRGRQGKRVLRRAARGLVPDEVIERPKHGFGMPIAGWLRTELRELCEEHFSERRLREDGFFAPGAVRRMLEAHVAGRANHRKPLWTLLAFQAWWGALTG